MATSETKQSPYKIVTGKVRLSYVNLFKPRKQDNSERETYSVLALIPKSDKATVAAINNAVAKMKTDPKAIKEWGSKWLASFKTPLRDGDTERDTDESPEYAGHWFMNCNSVSKPGVVDANVQAVIEEGEVYSGCYGRVSVNLYPYNKNGGIGIAAGLNNVQKLEDGEPLGGRSNPEDDFGPAVAEEEDFLN